MNHLPLWILIAVLLVCMVGSIVHAFQVWRRDETPLERLLRTRRECKRALKRASRHVE